MANETTADRSMHLRLLLPTEVLVDATAIKVIAAGEHGAFCLLPRHVDLVAALVPGVFIYHDNEGQERFVAVDRGLLVKCGREVLVSAPHAVGGEHLAELQALVEERFLDLDEQERKTRSTLARLEAGTLRRFRHLQDFRHG